MRAGTILLGSLLLVGALGVVPRAAQAGPASAKKKGGPAVRYSGIFALEVAYDDNIIHYSDQDLREFASVSAPGKYSIRTAGDWIIRPRIDLVAQTKALTGQTLEALLRLSSWRYVENGIKDNQSVYFRLKHPGFGRDNFQLILYHSPYAYLRNFRDRSPLAPASDPAQYVHFSYTSTSATLGYWRGLSAKLEGRLELKRSWRYYNRAFMENDNWEWRFGGYLAYRLARPLKVTGEYFFSAAKARAADEAGEDRRTSDDGDASYDRDSYRLALDVYLAEGWLTVNHFTAEGQYQAYYFTSGKPLDQDPTHVGRKDENVQFEFSCDTRPVLGPASLTGGYRFTKRDSSAPGGSSGAQSIDEDKDYTDHRIWVGVEVPF